MKLDSQELYNIKGGGIINATLFNALSRVAVTILNVGQIVGTTIRRFYTRNYC